jgi:hypothetical protein
MTMSEFEPNSFHLTPFIVPGMKDIEALRMSSAREFLNGHVNSFLIEGVAELSHNNWRSIKAAAMEDPNNPYRGWGPNRIKVGQLSPEDRIALGIAPDANPADDVYHPFDLPFAELDDDTKGKNIVPMVALCNGLGDIVLDESATIADLEISLMSFIDGSDDTINMLLSKIHHIAFVAGEIREGSRPYGATYRDDFPLFEMLDKPVQDLDRDVLVPVAEFLLSKFKPDDVGWNHRIGVALFNSNRAANIRYPLIASILVVCKGYDDLKNNTKIYAKDLPEDEYTPSFVKETRLWTREYTAYASDSSYEEVIAIRDELVQAGLIYKSQDGSWHRTPNTGNEVDDLIKELQAISS